MATAAKKAKSATKSRAGAKSRAAAKRTTTDPSQAVFEVAHARTPRRTDWGIYFTSDSPAAAGGGGGCFAWFGSEAALLRAITKHLVHFSPGPVSADAERVQARVAAIAADFEATPTGRTRTRTRLNRALRGFAVLRWWGDFASLAFGGRRFARDVRASFRDAEQGSSGPIGEAELDRFIEYLQMYGL